jgi:hypothetical protein
MGADKLATVRKLLAKAEGAATGAEAESYTAKAVELMARHGIDSALLATSGTDDRIGPLRLPVGDPYSSGKARLLGWTAAALGCRWVIHPMSSGRVAAVTVFGHASDRERVELLYTSLLLQATSKLVRLRPRSSFESVAAYRRSWLYGFAAEVHRRLVAAERAAAEQATADESGAGPSVALVLAGRRQQVESAFAATYPRLAAARRPALSGTGYSAGAMAGAMADLGGHGRDHGRMVARKDQPTTISP